MSANTEPKRGGGRPRKEENHAFAETFDYSPRHVRRALKELGAEGIKDLGQLKLLERQVTIAFRHLRGQREEHDLKVARRDVIKKDEVVRLGRRIGELTMAALNDLVQRSATECAGRSELQIYDWMKAVAADCVHNLLREVQKLDEE